MAGSLQGDPLLVLEQACSHEEYVEAFVRWESRISVWHHKAARAVLFLAVAVVLLAAVPLYRLWSVTIYLPGLLILFCLMAAFYFWKLRPKEIADWGGATYQENRLLGLPTAYRFYWEGVVFQNAYETVREYWADFEKCVEDDRFFILSGGRERGLLILCKDPLTPEKTEKTRLCLSEAFGPRYFRSRDRKGGRA